MQRARWLSLLLFTGIFLTVISEHWSSRPAVAQSRCGKTLTIWLNAFIPNNAPGAFILPGTGIHSGKTAIYGPGRAGCFLTDQRACSAEINKTARMHSRIIIDLEPESVYAWRVLSKDHHISPSIEAGCKSGNEECTHTATRDHMWWGQLDVIDGSNARVTLYAAASVACPRGLPAPRIQYTGTIYLTRLSSTAIRVAFVGHTTEYPAFEMYAALGTAAPDRLFCQGPIAETPYRLFPAPLGPGLSVPISSSVVLTRRCDYRYVGYGSPIGAPSEHYSDPPMKCGSPSGEWHVYYVFKLPDGTSYDFEEHTLRLYEDERGDVKGDYELTHKSAGPGPTTCILKEQGSLVYSPETSTPGESLWLDMKPKKTMVTPPTSNCYLLTQILDHGPGLTRASSLPAHLFDIGHFCEK